MSRCLNELRVSYLQVAGRVKKRSMVFGIGLSKTGTTSLCRALEFLGYRTVDYPAPSLMMAGKFYAALKGYDAATDITVSAFFRELDRAFPGSRFILTQRSMEPWLESLRRHMSRSQFSTPKFVSEGDQAKMRQLMYRTSVFNEKLAREAMLRHEEAVSRHFALRQEALLCLDVTTGEGWGPLCAFLGKQVPQISFPHENRTPAEVP